MVLMWILMAVVVVVAAAGVSMLVGLWRLSRNQPATGEIALGASNGALSPCPESPNCVSTQADPSDAAHYVPPIAYPGSRDAVREALARWVGRQADAELVTSRDDYLHAVFSSRLFGFRDDLELVLPESEPVVHLRSASRVGYGDMNVNRKRYEAVRQAVRAAHGEVPAEGEGGTDR